MKNERDLERKKRYCKKKKYQGTEASEIRQRRTKRIDEKKGENNKKDSE